MIYLELKPLRVSEVNQYIKKVFSNDIILSSIKVEGEISNFKHHYSGHMYFSLKDERSKLKCVMFRSDNQTVDFQLEDGLKVVITGYISIYEKEGDYQLYAKKIEKSGIGDLFAAFEEMKKKLEKEGLFDPINKKSIPFMPKKIGVVTSSTGAAIRDIITVIKRRYPIVDVLIYPVLVQGEQAACEICDGLSYLDKRDDIDVIITGRGGGSMEELFAFNDERVARTIFSMNKPVISAVGHETDFTIADFVADLRAPTPSVAAELATPELDKLKENLKDKLDRLNKNYLYILNNNCIKLKYIKKGLAYYNPINQIKEKAQELDNIFKNLTNLMYNKINENKDYINNLYSKINYLNPISYLEKGYGLLLDEKGNTITSINDVKLNQDLYLMIKDGMLTLEVVKISKGEFYNE